MENWKGKTYTWLLIFLVMTAYVFFFGTLVKERALIVILIWLVLTPVFILLLAIGKWVASYRKIIFYKSNIAFWDEVWEYPVPLRMFEGSIEYSNIMFFYFEEPLCKGEKTQLVLFPKNSLRYRVAMDKPSRQKKVQRFLEKKSVLYLSDRDEIAGLIEKATQKN